MKILSLSLLVLLAFSTANAAARLDITCNFEDCGHAGWSEVVWGGNYRSDTDCKDGDCFQNGWLLRDNYGNQVQAVCKTGGCWVAGWNDTQWVNGRVEQEDVTCNNNDCLANGWSTTTTWGETRHISCGNSDCAHSGWTTLATHNSITMCKMSDCFRYGWTTDVY